MGILCIPSYLYTHSVYIHIYPGLGRVKVYIILLGLVGVRVTHAHILTFSPLIMFV